MEGLFVRCSSQAKHCSLLHNSLSFATPCHATILKTSGPRMRRRIHRILAVCTPLSRQLLGQKAVPGIVAAVGLSIEKGVVMEAKRWML